MATEYLQIEHPGTPPDRPPIDLAQERPFWLGALVVEPALREIAAPGSARQTLEPRVMQVLVALHRAEGAIVGRDELIRTCWNGTVVGEGAINRAISLLRRVSEGIGGESFRIETVSKVGYRLVRPGHDSRGPTPASEPARASAGVDRRRLAWAALPLAIAAACAALLLRPPGDGPAYSIRVEPFRVSGAAASFNEELVSTLTSQNVPLAAGRNRLTLAGSVDERDGAIRVNARLTVPDSRDVLWSGAIARPAGEPGGVARAAAVIGLIAQCALAGANDGGDAVSTDLLSAYARTCELGYRGQSPQGLRAARELTRRAAEFAPGWFARSFHALTVYRRQPGEDPGLHREALAAADRLIALRPDAQDGYASKFAALDPKPTVERERLLLRAMRLEPLYADVAQGYFADFLMQVGRLEEAFQLRWQMAQQRPDDAPAHAELFRAAVATGRWPIADASLERVRQLEPRGARGLLWHKAMQSGDWAQAERLMPVEHPAQQQAASAAFRALASKRSADRQAAARLVEVLPTGCCLRLRIELLTRLDHRGEAIELLAAYNTAATPPTRVGLQFLWEPAMRPLWHDPAFAPFLRRNGWIAYWNEAKVAPDVCRERTPPPFCRLLRG
ncbi:MAG TPA: winged helix-turn-helix domain-containing protein [Croceibacterium sp.]|nr:winged helix-turn-helix domain-containing protein [Croceibacterium sp.]